MVANDWSAVYHFIGDMVQKQKLNFPPYFPFRLHNWCQKAKVWSLQIMIMTVAAANQDSGGRTECRAWTPVWRWAILTTKMSLEGAEALWQLKWIHRPFSEGVSNRCSSGLDRALECGMCVGWNMPVKDSILNVKLITYFARCRILIIGDNGFRDHCICQ